MYSVEFAYNIVPSDEAGQGLSNLLIRQLAAIESGKGLQQAARSLGVSYRYFWGQIEIWEERFGQKLVIREQGKRARLSPLGQKLLWAERTVMANYAVQMEKMRTELNAAFAAACNPDADIVTIAGCFDPWLATLPVRKEKKRSEGPLSGCTPTEKAAGKIINPANTAITVSMVTI